MFASTAGFSKVTVAQSPENTTDLIPEIEESPSKNSYPISLALVKVSLLESKSLIIKELTVGAVVS